MNFKKKKKPEGYTVRITRRFGKSKPYYIGHVYKGHKYLEFVSGDTEEEVIRNAKKRVTLETETEDYGTRTFEL